MFLPERMPMPPLSVRLALLVAAGLIAAPVLAQRAAENALQAADDGFGTAIGRESIGLYSADDIRGFSAVDAGNVRLEGLYFDPASLPPSLLRGTTSIRVGLAAQGFAFPAPTGVVDIRLRHAGTRPAATLFLSADSFGFITGEATWDQPLGSGIGLAVGAGAYREAYPNGTTDQTYTANATLDWQISRRLKLTALASATMVRAAEPPPVYLTADGQPPPRVDRGRFQGPDGLFNSRDRRTLGLIGDWQAGPWHLQAGLFHSKSDAPRTVANLYLDVTTTGAAQQLLVVDPAGRNRVTSGELRLDRSITDGPRTHMITLSARWRDRQRQFGGSALVDLGSVQLNQPAPPLPALPGFGPRDDDRIRQATVGLAYELRWPGIANLSLGLQKTRYRKQATPAASPPATERASPWLVTAAAAIPITQRLGSYASFAQGLEDRGAAPGSASNRNQPLPASATRQIDAGLRWQVAGPLALVAGVFELSRPYFQFDATGRFSRLGDTRSRGLELSLSGPLSPRLDILAGAVIGRTSVVSAAVRDGLVGSRAVGRPDGRGSIALEWRPAFASGLRINAAVNHITPVVASNDNKARAPARTTIDLGLRQALKIAAAPAQLRLVVTNIANQYGVEVLGSGVYDISAGRAAQLSLGVDF